MRARNSLMFGGMGSGFRAAEERIPFAVQLDDLRLAACDRRVE
jgi:hypothetical protein